MSIMPVVEIEKDDPELHELLLGWMKKKNNPYFIIGRKVYEKRNNGFGGYYKSLRSDLMEKAKPNEPCICGSGIKYKKCCME